MLDTAIENLKDQIRAKQEALAVLEEQRALLTPKRKPRAVADDAPMLQTALN